MSFDKSKTREGKLVTLGKSLVKRKQIQRLSTKISEFDLVLGGGLISDSVVLIAGSPGVGKSTLLLQAANKLAEDMKVIYISGEETLSQVRERSCRLGYKDSEILFSSETNLKTILRILRKEKPKVFIIDSIQAIFNPDISSLPGMPSQVKSCAIDILNFAKKIGIACFVLGHVVKGEKLAGPKALEHIVDTVLYFEETSLLRILRAHKNRFGSTNEVGMFRMGEKGLEEISNPSELFLEGRVSRPGSVVVTLVQGSRVLALEVQSLLSQNRNQQKQIVGLNSSRVLMLLNILETLYRLPLRNFSITLSVPGGLSVLDSSADLGIVCSLVSSFRHDPISSKVAVIGEVGLGGEIRRVPALEKRIETLRKLGFEKIIVSQLPSTFKQNIEGVKEVKNIEEGVNEVFEYSISRG